MNTLPEGEPGARRPVEPPLKAPNVIVDLGKRSRKQVKRLKTGRGPLVTEILDCVDELRSEGKIPASAEPVIVVVERRQEEGSWCRWL
jgi:hypothetical protein